MRCHAIPVWWADRRCALRSLQEVGPHAQRMVRPAPPPTTQPPAQPIPPSRPLTLSASGACAGARPGNSLRCLTKREPACTGGRRHVCCSGPSLPPFARTAADAVQCQQRGNSPRSLPRVCGLLTAPPLVCAQGSARVALYSVAGAAALGSVLILSALQVGLGAAVLAALVGFQTLNLHWVPYKKAQPRPPPRCSRAPGKLPVYA